MSWRLEQRQPVTHQQSYQLLRLLFAEESEFVHGLRVLYPEIQTLWTMAQSPNVTDKLHPKVVEAREYLGDIFAEIAQALNKNITIQTR